MVCSRDEALLIGDLEGGTRLAVSVCVCKPHTAEFEDLDGLDRLQIAEGIGCSYPCLANRLTTTLRAPT